MKVVLTSFLITAVRIFTKITLVSWTGVKKSRLDFNNSFVSVVVAQDVQAVEGKSVSLPCDVVPPGHDKVYMVFWFQYGSGYPIYR